MAGYLHFCVPSHQCLLKDSVKSTVRKEPRGGPLAFSGDKEYGPEKQNLRACARPEPGLDPFLSGVPFLKPTLAPLGGKGTLLSPEPHWAFLTVTSVYLPES